MTIKNKRINGVQVTKALKETALGNGISVKLLCYRLKKKWGAVRSCTEPPRKQAESVKSNPGMLALAKSNGISSQLYNSRVRMYGYSEYDAATEPIMNKDDKAALSAEARGGIDKELIEEAASNGIEYGTLYRRLRVCKTPWDEHNAVTVPPIKDRIPSRTYINREAEALGIDWREIRGAKHGNCKFDPVAIAIAEYNGIKYDTFKDRMKRSKSRKWSELEAATTPLTKTKTS